MLLSQFLKAEDLIDRRVPKSGRIVHVMDGGTGSVPIINSFLFSCVMGNIRIRRLNLSLHVVMLNSIPGSYQL